MAHHKNIRDIYNQSTHVSFEVFPPKTAKGLKQIYQSIGKLAKLGPDFFSVTYGAGGSTAEKSLDIASAITNLAQVTCVAHFTCMGMNKEQVLELLHTFEGQGVQNVLALRGDRPQDPDFVQPKDGFNYANELVAFIRKHSPELGILVAGNPEGHMENPSKEDDFQRLIDKVRAGADGIVTQATFENRHLFEFRDKLSKAGVEVPIAVGIFPISNAKQIKRIIELSGASVPDELAEGIEKYMEDPEGMLKFGTEFAVRQVEELIRGGMGNFHFYTMNRHQQTYEILYALKQYFPQLHFN